ncbi:MAG: electron transport complex subunit RsxC [Bacteroidetes bacterium]|nr:electron transport complex subunit RsxC [Bacteroidota bacterium]MBU1579729.1 electron transport complex subunit RsxC [Bacteroidota bacterium]MBU2466742.1 electron transport complex subunit RsxC [Bacteroidota bacterium]MBU2556399.1 electron transport complex subunit RsxC [Bacteroidota bacterium]
MKSLKTFTIGGVHPEENKRSANAPIQQLSFPKQAIVPLGQNLGAPSKPIVKRGDEIKTGQLIAKGESFISANLHSPFTGKVLKIDDLLDSSGYRRPAVVIEVGDDVWEEGIDTSAALKREISDDKQSIIDKIKANGIVGLGGATFPTHVKLMVPDGKKAEFLIINGVECEPYLTSDHRLMLEKGEEMLIGIKILMKALSVDQAIVGIENNKADAIKHLTELAQKYEGISIQPLKVKYPQGGEKQLIKAAVNREVPSGKLPIEVGCVVTNVGTAFAVYEAVQKNKPLIERVVTVTGKAVRKPSNFMVRVGTPVQMLLDAAEGLPENTGKMINGGPMMGKAIMSAEVPVVKGTSGILLMKKEESRRKTPQTCIRCSKCTTVCPMGLEPFLLAKMSRLERYEESEKERIMDCIECGSCQFTCPSHLPLLDYLRLGKQRVGQLIRSRK